MGTKRNPSGDPRIHDDGTGVLHLACPNDSDLFVTDRRNDGNGLEPIPGERVRLTISGPRGSGSVDVKVESLVDLVMGVALAFGKVDLIAAKLDEWAGLAASDDGRPGS
jgi:hypothetical protein